MYFFHCNQTFYENSTRLHFNIYTAVFKYQVLSLLTVNVVSGCFYCCWCGGGGVEVVVVIVVGAVVAWQGSSKSVG